ncbi:MAG: hypothetical protein ACTSQX_08675 [Candidatus Heimdallarchaeota archaeon]
MEEVPIQDQLNNHVNGAEYKITRATEEIWFVLLLLCVVQNKWSGTGFLQQLVDLSGRTPKTVSKSLQQLEELNIINISTVGRSKHISINFTSEFFHTSFILLLGFLESGKSTKKRLLVSNNGIIPANLSFDRFLEKIEAADKKISQEIVDYENYLDWIIEQEQWCKNASNITVNDPVKLENNPLYQFAEDLVTKFNKEAKHHVNGLTFPVQKRLLLEMLDSERLDIPWLFSSDTKRKFTLDEM